MSDLVFFRTPGQSRGRRFMKSDQPMNYTLNFGFRFSCGFLGLRWVIREILLSAQCSGFSFRLAILKSLLIISIEMGCSVTLYIFRFDFSLG